MSDPLPNLNPEEFTDEEQAIWQAAFDTAKEDGKNSSDAIYEADDKVRKFRSSNGR